MIIRILALLVGILILGGGLFYLAREKSDREARRVYTVTAAVGALLTAGALLALLL